MGAQRQIAQRAVARSDVAILFGGRTDCRQGRAQCVAPGPHHLHIGRAPRRRSGETLRGLLVNDLAGDAFVERSHRPVEQPQRFRSGGGVFGRQRIFRIIALQMIDDGP
jgi:hypothetical protein